MDSFKEASLDGFLRRCKKELERDPENEYIEIEMDYLIKKFANEEAIDVMISRLVEKLLELELYITDGHYRLTENPARYSRRIRDLDRNELIRIYNY